MACSLTVEILEKVVNGEILSVHKSSFAGVSTDSRCLEEGNLFIPLVGQNYDGHDFLSQACQRGSAVVLAHKKEIAKSVKDECSVIFVEDTLVALQNLAQYWRKQCRAQVVGITGSNGKTTTKNFLVKILSSDYVVSFSKASFNNHWGVPITLLSAGKEDDFIIVEMGMNRPGELRRLSQIACPDLVLVTQVGLAHAGFFKGIEEIAKAKEEIYEFNPQAKFVFNLDNKYTRLMYEKYKKDDSLCFSKKECQADVIVQAQPLSLRGLQVHGHIGREKEQVEATVLVPIFGEYNVYNLMAASSLALALGVCPKIIWKNLRYLRSSWGRGQLYIFESGPRVLFDAYNANPESMRAFIESACKTPLSGRRFFILGEMAELNDYAEALHRELAGFLALKHPDVVCLIGPSSALMGEEMRRQGFRSKLILSDSYREELAIQVRNMLNPEDLVFVKGSRKLRLEQFLNDWELDQYQ